MHQFKYIAPRSLADTVNVLLDYGNDAKVLAGGTDLLIQMRKGLYRPQILVDIKKIVGLDQIVFSEESIDIGAAVSLWEVEKFLATYREYSVLSQAIHSVGSYQVRARATLAGNICNASPAADTATALVVLDALVKIYGPQGHRFLPIEEFFIGPRQTVVEPGEVVTGISLPRMLKESRGIFLKKSRRPFVDLATVNVAALLSGATLKVALGAVGPTIVRATGTEQFIARDGLSPETALLAAKLAPLAARPISDVRGSRAYRLALVEVLTGRALSELCRAGGG